MHIDTNKMRQCGNEINRLASLISNNIIEYYNIVREISNKAWTGSAANIYINNILGGKDSALQSINALKSEGNLIIGFASEIENKINSVKR